MVDGSSIAPRPGKFSTNDSFDDLDKLDDYWKGAPTSAEQTARNAKAAWALKLLDDFATKPQGSPFWLYRRRDVADQLKARVNDPTQINQSDTWLCGVTSVVRAWAQDTPVDYAWLGIQLYDLGRGRLGRGELLGKVVQPSADLRNSPLPMRMAPADWMTLASVHETCNILGVRNFTKDEGLLHNKAWQTAREVAIAYKAAGYRNVIDCTGFFHTSNFTFADLEKANDYLRQGYRVSLLIDSKLLNDNTIADTSMHSNHWVGMLETINVTASQEYIPAFNVFSWGKTWPVPKNGSQIRLRDFLGQFYGFVAARMY